MNERERARDLRLDWALAERLRGERPPDLTARILARHRDGDGVVLAQRLAVTASPRWRAVRVAALLLLGLAVVVAAALWLAQGLGGILTGSATDPGTGPLLALLALAFWPLATPARET